MTTESMYDLSFEFKDDGTLRLVQGNGFGETAVIDLHPAQLRLLCERAGLLSPEVRKPLLPSSLLKRADNILVDIETVTSDAWMGEIMDRITDALVFQITLNNVEYGLRCLIEDIAPYTQSSESGMATQQICGEDPEKALVDSSPSAGGDFQLTPN